MTDAERDALLIEIHTLQKVGTERLNDHGKRIRALETFRNWAGGAGAVIAALIAATKLKIKVGQ